MEKKSFLFIFSNAPHQNSSAKEGMDFAFSCAAFEQKVDALFMDEGVYQLVPNQLTEDIGVKNHSAAIEAFELYGIERCFYDEESLAKAGLKASQLSANASPLPENFWQEFSNYDFVFSY